MTKAIVILTSEAANINRVILDSPDIHCVLCETMNRKFDYTGVRAANMLKSYHADKFIFI
jgi:hypothetical protein